MPPNDQVIRVIIIVTNSISFMSSLLMILVYFRFKPLQTLPFKLVMCLNLADLFFSIGNLIYFYPPEIPMLCQLQAYMINASQLSSLLWTAIIAWTLYLSVMKRNPNLNFRFYLWLGYATPYIFSLYPLYFGDYGLGGVQCWINSDDEDKTEFLRMINFYIPLLSVLTFNSLLYVRVIRYINNMLEEEHDTSYVNRLIIYPIILVICWILPAFNKTYIEISDTHFTFLLYLSKALTGLMGFFNSLAYGFTRQVRDEMRCNLRIEQPKEQEMQRNDVSTDPHSFVSEE